MATFNTSFFEAGKGSAVKLPELDAMERSSRRSGDLAIRGAEMKLEQSLRTKQRMLNDMKVDPVSIGNDILMNRQALDYEKYSNDMGALLLENKGELDANSEYKATVLKNNLAVKQEKLLAQSKIADGILNTFKGDMRNYYDKEYGMDRYKKWLQDPDKNPLDASALKINPQDFGTALANSKIIGTPDVITDIKVVKDATGKETRWATDYSVVMNRDEAKQFIPQHALSNDAYLEDVIRSFDRAPQAETMPYMKDYNKDGVVDPKDYQYTHDHTNITDSPVLQWAANNPFYQKQAMQMRAKGGATEVKERTVGSGSPVNIGGADLKVSPATKRTTSVVYGDKTYNDSYAFAGNTTLSNLPTLGGLRFRGTSSHTLKMGNITGKLKDYVADGDMIIIEAATGIPELDIETKGLVAIPANSIQGADNLPIIKDGKQTTLGAIRGQKPTDTSTQTETPADRMRRLANGGGK